MSGVKHIKVEPADDGQRLDRWLKKCVPELPYMLAQKLIRKGAIRVDGKRGKPDTRLVAGQEIRLPPLEDKPERQKKKKKVLSAQERDYIKSLVIYDDGDVVAFNKPSGLASQGGGGVDDHIDKYFPALEKKGMAPRLIHRLDRDTSGILLTARSPEAVRRLGKSFKDRNVRKIYWAVTVGVPEQMEGAIKAPLAKAPGPHKDKMVIDEKKGKFALTDFIVLDKMGAEAAFVAFWPRTGRTHQIRAHAAAVLGCPILNDDKYGGRSEVLVDMKLASQMHLHAKRLVLPHPLKKEMIDLIAPLPPALAESWKELGFETNDMAEPFADTVLKQGK